MREKIQKIMEWFSAKKLKQKIRSLFIIIMSFYFLLFLLIYIFIIYGSRQKYISETNYNMLVSIGSSLERELEGASTVSKWIMNSQEVRNYLKRSEEAQSIDDYNAVASIYEFTTFEEYISSVYLFKNNGEYVHISNGVTSVNHELIQTEAWNKDVYNMAGAYMIRINGNHAFQTASGKPVISFIRLINDIQTQKPIGILAINYSDELLSSTYRDFTDSERKFGYFDSNGTLICGDAVLSESCKNFTWNNSREFYTEKISGNKTVYCYQIPGTPLTAVTYEEVRFWDYVSTQSLILIAAFIFMTVVSLILVGIFMSFYITQPIERLVQSMDGVKNGWLKRVSLKLPNDEMGHLKDSYNNMLIELNHLIDQLVEKETAIRQAELEALQEQIKPHFLYNTLDTIGYLALEKPGEEVYDAVETLGSFYRKFLSKGNREITLHDEIEIVKNYLKLQKLRYEDVFEDSYHLEEEALNIRVPKLILQPLVENSIYHGIRPKGEKGLIEISVWQENETIMISVYDTGVGMTKEELRRINEEEGKSFGLRKTIERLRNYYGIEEVCEIKSEPGHYCSIILKLPRERKERVNHVQGNDY